MDRKKDFVFSSNDIRCFVEDDEGSVWIGTFNGLNKIDRNGGVTCYRKDMTPGALKHSSIFSLYKDRQGTIWVGTYYGGAHYFHPEVDLFRHYSENDGRQDGVSFPYVGNMVEDKRGDVWICTEGGGLNRWDRKTDAFTHYLSGKKQSPYFPNLKCIEYDKQNDCLYIGTHKQGFLRFDIASATVKRSTDYSYMNESFNEAIISGDSLFLLSTEGLFVSGGYKKILNVLSRRSLKLCVKESLCL